MGTCFLVLAARVIQFWLNMESSTSESSHSNSDSEYSENSEGTLNVLNEFRVCEGTQPYMFEPYDSDASENSSNLASSDEEELNERLENTDWCACGNCQIMDRGEECVCCQEVESVVTKNHEAVEVEGLHELPSCITQHPGFHAVCLNHWVLQTAWFQYKQQYKDSYEGREHKQNRHIAYRQLARWCWGILGKDLRVVLPSCAVSCIRAHFPPPGIEENFVFEGFHHANN